MPREAYPANESEDPSSWYQIGPCPERFASMYRVDDPAREHEPATSDSGRWSRSGSQFLSGAGYGLLGSYLGAVTGAVAGLVWLGVREPSGDETCDRHCDLGAVFVVLVSSGIGSVLGWPIGAGYGVSTSAPARHPSRGILPGVLGATLGTAGGMALGLAAGDQDVFSLGVLFGAPAGALLVDRLFARDPNSVSVAPWSPRPGMQGARVGLAF